MAILATFPATPARFLATLLDRATGERPEARRLAQALLKDATGLSMILADLLSHTRSAVRMIAAEWLEELDAKDAADALLAAARVERHEGARGAMILALARLGGKASEFLSPARFLADAVAGLRGASRKRFRWLPRELAEGLVYRDGSPVPATVLRWWMTLADSIRAAGGNPLLENYLDHLATRSAAQLGSAIVDAWHAGSGNARTAGEMLGDKGVLGLATRASGHEAARAAKILFKNHFNRIGHCRAMLDCLASNPSFDTVHFVIDVAKHWRTPGLQGHAIDLLSRMPDRHGWNAEEAVDRLAPAGGFDGAGTLVLPPIGLLVHTARLDADHEIRLFRPDGTPVATIPHPEGTDDVMAFRPARRVLRIAKKEIKDVVAQQRERLYAAMCSQRTWTVREWSGCVLDHPAIRVLAARLVWIGCDARGDPLTCFQLRHDRSLVDAEGGVVATDNFTGIRLAHRSTIGIEQAVTWRELQRSQGVEPLFDQLERKVRDISPSEAEFTQIDERRGWMIRALRLRTVARKLGYGRGPTDDDNRFDSYVKRFTAPGLATMITFSGNRVPEENLYSALLGLKFVSLETDGRGSLGPPIALGAVPKVLLSEAWSDLYAIAEAGDGYVRNWQAQSEW